MYYFCSVWQFIWANKISRSLSFWRSFTIECYVIFASWPSIFCQLKLGVLCRIWHCVSDKHNGKLKARNERKINRSLVSRYIFLYIGIFILTCGPQVDYGSFATVTSEALWHFSTKILLINTSCILVWPFSSRFLPVRPRVMSVKIPFTDLILQHKQWAAKEHSGYLDVFVRGNTYVHNEIMKRKFSGIHRCALLALLSLMLRTTGLASEDSENSPMIDVELALEHELISLKVCMWFNVWQCIE